MPDGTPRPRRSQPLGEPEIPPPTGATYNTANRAKTGVGHEPPVKDLRQKGERAK